MNKKDTIRLSFLITFVCILLIILTYNVFEDSEEMILNDEVLEEMDKYWTCMDGCYNMQEIIYGKERLMNDTNNEMMNLHKNCSAVCCKQQMITLGCGI